ncbi:MAG: hypothetical protein CM15mP74_17100 [Halieaceae bacterium]|nr:MAG: hypothetical protein CM15mP74_17100 [Halieaceae bacterium]
MRLIPGALSRYQAIFDLPRGRIVRRILELLGKVHPFEGPPRGVFKSIIITRGYSTNNPGVSRFMSRKNQTPPKSSGNPTL